jgi:hypothetical protein
MNQLTNKALLWNKCVDQGIFNNVNKGDAPRIQPLFESTLDSFNNRFEDLEVLNNEFIIKIKEEINKLNSFEERQKEYDKLLKTNTPPKIDFSDKIDEPLKNIDSLVEQTQQMRQEVFKSLDKQPAPNNNMLNSNTLNTNPLNNTMLNSNSFTNNNLGNFDLQKVIKTQNDILIKILETQNKILQIINK